jgi:hypothetical protein
MSRESSEVKNFWEDMLLFRGEGSLKLRGNNIDDGQYDGRKAVALASIIFSSGDQLKRR